MNEQNSAPGSPSANSGQPQTDTQRLRAVEATVRSLVPRVEALESRVHDTRQTLSLLRTMVESILTAQASIRDDLGVLKASVDLMSLIAQRVEALGEKIDKLAAQGGSNA